MNNEFFESWKYLEKTTNVLKVELFSQGVSFTDSQILQLSSLVIITYTKLTSDDNLYQIQIHFLLLWLPVFLQTVWADQMDKQKSYSK